MKRCLVWAVLVACFAGTSWAEPGVKGEAGGNSQEARAVSNTEAPSVQFRRLPEPQAAEWRARVREWLGRSGQVQRGPVQRESVQVQPAQSGPEEPTPRWHVVLLGANPAVAAEALEPLEAEPSRGLAASVRSPSVRSPRCSQPPPGMPLLAPGSGGPSREDSP